MDFPFFHKSPPDPGSRGMLEGGGSAALPGARASAGGCLCNASPKKPNPKPPKNPPREPGASARPAPCPGSGSGEGKTHFILNRFWGRRSGVPAGLGKDVGGNWEGMAGLGQHVLLLTELQHRSNSPAPLQDTPGSLPTGLERGWRGWWEAGRGETQGVSPPWSVFLLHPLPKPRLDLPTPALIILGTLEGGGANIKSKRCFPSPLPKPRGLPEEPWLPHHWKCPRLSWMGFGTPWVGGVE